VRIGWLDRFDGTASVAVSAIEVQVGGGIQGTQVNSDRHQGKQRMVHWHACGQLLVQPGEGW
jgi:hypothetical protein